MQGDRLKATSRKLTEDDFFVEAQPVVQIVEVDGIKDFPFVLDVVGAEDGLAGSLAVVIAGNSGIEFIDGSLIELATFLLENPRFALRIRWFFSGDEFGEGFFGDAEAVENHLVVASADRRIIIMQFTSGAQGRFLPQARQVEDSDWAGDAGTDHGDDFAHGKSSSVMVVDAPSHRLERKILLRHCRSRLRSILKTKSRQQMKRNRANLIPATSPGPDPVLGASNRPAQVIALLLPLLSIGCSSFEREWKKSTTPPGPAGARATAQPPTTPLARAQEGAWTGMWSSTGTGHTGKLRCLVKVIPPGEAGPPETAQFTYHAVWGVFSGVFQTTQPIEPQKNDSLRSAGSWKLPRWAGGQYDYDMSLTGSRFEGIWTGGGDTGTFQLARPVPEEPGS